MLEQRVKLSPRRFVAFAGGFFHSFDVEDLYSAPRVTDHSSLLQRVRDDRDAASLHAKHLCQKFLREVQCVAA